MNWNEANELNEKVKANTIYKAFKLVFDILSRPVIALLNRWFSR